MSDKERTVIDGREPIFKPELDGDRVRIMAADREDLYLTHEGQWRSTRIDHWPTREAAEAFLASLAPTPAVALDKLDSVDDAKLAREILEPLAGIVVTHGWAQGAYDAAFQKAREVLRRLVPADSSLTAAIREKAAECRRLAAQCEGDDPEAVHTYLYCAGQLELLSQAARSAGPKRIENRHGQDIRLPKGHLIAWRHDDGRTDAMILRKGSIDHVGIQCVYLDYGIPDFSPPVQEQSRG